MKMAKFCKVDRYSKKYYPVFRNTPLYCKCCNGDLIGGKTIENEKEQFFLECDNCGQKVSVKEKKRDNNVPPFPK